MDVDHGQVVGRGLKDVAVIVDLHELTPVGGRATGRRIPKTHRPRLTEQGFSWQAGADQAPVT